jgi:hypothetical protein
MVSELNSALTVEPQPPAQKSGQDARAAVFIVSDE